MVRFTPIAISIVCLSAMSGCSYFRTTTVASPADGLTIVLPGIGGSSVVSSNIAQGLVDGEVPGTVEVFDWTTGNPLRSLQHLRDQHRVLTQAHRLAQRIEAAQLHAPSRPVSIVAHSGGAGVILKALEHLPDDRSIRSIVLLAPAVSAAYPIEDVIHKVEGGIWLFYSPLDLQSTTGTSIVGTIDRDFAPSAGGYGLNHSVTDLVQIPYDASMATSGNLGGHLGATNRRFVREAIAPIVRNAHILNQGLK